MTWDNRENKQLKYKYENETNSKSGECVTYKLNKEALEKHLRELEIKNKWKNKKYV